MKKCGDYSDVLHHKDQQGANLMSNIKYGNKVKQLYLSLKLILALFPKTKLNMKIPANILLALNRKASTYSSRELYKNLQRSIIYISFKMETFKYSSKIKSTIFKMQYIYTMEC